MAAWRAFAAAMLALALSACVGLGPAQRQRAEAVVEAGRSDASSCDSADACAQSSPLHQLAADAFAQSDTPKTIPTEGAKLMHETFRPQFHYTPITGWLNDANGLFYYAGKWHLFHQFRPPGVPEGWAHD